MRRVLLTAILMACAGVVPALVAPLDWRAPVHQAPAAQAPAPRTGIILGQVVDASTGDPLSNSTVTLQMRGLTQAGQGAPVPQGVNARTQALMEAGLAGGGRGAAPAGLRQLTDASGHFVFHDLPKGNVQLSASAPGYITASSGQARPGGPSRPVELGDNDRAGDVKIRLWKYAVVSGTVLDDAGEPAVGVAVRVLRRTIAAGKPKLTPAATTTTDDRGMYRVSSLTPGDYVVAMPQTQVTMPAAIVDGFMQSIVSGAGGGAGNLIMDMMSSGGPPPTMGGIRVGDLLLQSPGGDNRFLPPAPAADGRVFAYQTTFFPAASSSAQAGIITLRSGEEKPGVDLQLRVIQTARVSGTVMGPEGPMSGVGVRLLPVTTDDLAIDTGFEVATTITMPDGSFTMLGVPVGQFIAKVIKAPRPTMPAELAQNSALQFAFGGAFGSAAPTGAAAMLLSAQSPVTVTGADVMGISLTLREGARVSGRLVFEGAAAQPTAQQLAAANIALRAVDDQMAAAQIQPVHPDAEGKFKTSAYPPGKYVPSGIATFPSWRATSVTVAGREMFEPLELKDADVSNVVVTFTDKIGQVTGTVRTGSGTAAATATVVLFPADRRLWTQDSMNSRAPRTALASKTGSYTAAGLLSGDYFIAALDDLDVGDIQDPAFLDALIRVATRVSLTEGERKAQDLQTVKVK